MIDYEWIAEMIKASGLSHEAIGDKAGCHRMTVWKSANGYQCNNVSILEAMLGVFGYELAIVPRDFPESIRTFIMMERDRQGMTRQDLEAESGVSIATICDIENGRRENPGIHVVEALVEALGYRLEAVPR